MTSKHHRFAVFLAGLPLLAVSPASHAQATGPVPLPAGTEVMVRTLDPMSSTTATTGQKFAVEVDADVVVDGVVILPAGTRGAGTIVFARKKGMSGRPGALDVRIDSVEGPSGPIKLRASETNRGEDNRRSGMAAGMVFGLIGAAAVQGTDINLPAGSLIPTTVVAPRSTAHATAPLPAAATDASPALTQASEAAAPSNPAPQDQP